MASRIGMDEKEMPVTEIHALSFTEEIAAVGEEFRYRRNLLAEKEYVCEGQTYCDKQASYDLISADKKIFFLLALIKNTNMLEVRRQLSSIHLRRLLTTHFEFAWNLMSLEGREEVKDEIITLISNEGEKIGMRKKLCEVTAELVRNLIDENGNNTWPEFLQYLLQMANNASVPLKENALYIFSIIPGIFRNLEANYVDVIKQMLAKLFIHQKYSVRFYAGKALAGFITEHEKEESIQNRFSDLVPHYFKVLQESVILREDNDLLKMAIEIIRLSPKFVGLHLGKFLGLCQTIAEGEQISLEWRNLALKFCVTTFKTVPGALKEFGQHFSPPLIELVERETETSGGDSEGKGEWLSRSDHPLRNPLILEKVFENVKLKKDLKECRVVSKIWNHLMIPFVRPEVTVTIYGNQSQHETHRIDQFVEDFSTNSLGIPIENFKLEAVGTTDVHGKEFLKLCWETAKSIEFDDKFDNEVCYMIEDLSELLKSSQKLEYLRLDVNMSSKSGDVIKLFPENSKPSLSCLKKLDMHRLLISSPPTQSKERRKCCPTFIEELLEIAPNVSHITSSGWSNEIEESGCSLKDILTAIGNLGREASIKTLVCNTVTKEDIETMQGMTEKLNGLRLKTLEFEFVRSEGDYGGFFSALVQLITTLRDSLEHLDMWEAVFDSFFQLPRMSRLKSLVIGISEDFNSRGVDLNQIFPTLKTLRLACRDDNPTFDEFLSESEPFLTLKSFQCNPGSLYLSLNAFTQILKVFPKLTSLCLDIKEPHGVKILNQIWTNMPQLELLAIAFLHPMREVESLDSVFTGISFQTLEDIKHIVNSQIMGEMTPKLRRDTISNLKIQHCHLPSIGNLTNLRYLEIIDWSDDGTDLTDLTGYLGLYLMPGLKHVKIDGCKFTEAASDLLKVDLGLETCSLA